MNARILLVASGTATLLISSSDNKHECVENLSIRAAKRLCLDENSPFENVYALGLLFDSRSNMIFCPPAI